MRVGVQPNIAPHISAVRKSQFAIDVRAANAIANIIKSKSTNEAEAKIIFHRGENTTLEYFSITDQHIICVIKKPDALFICDMFDKKTSKHKNLLQASMLF